MWNSQKIKECKKRYHKKPDKIFQMPEIWKLKNYKKL